MHLERLANRLQNLAKMYQISEKVTCKDALQLNDNVQLAAFWRMREHINPDIWSFVFDLYHNGQSVICEVENKHDKKKMNHGEIGHTGTTSG